MVTMQIMHLDSYFYESLRVAFAPMYRTTICEVLIVRDVWSLLAK